MKCGFDIWILNQLKEIEGLQRGIVVQQSTADETLDMLKKESARVLKKINELNSAMCISRYISPELERAVKEVSARAVGIDEKVPDATEK